MDLHSKRVFRRHHIGDAELPLTLQSDGILVSLRTHGHWFNRMLGRVIIKNISAGGAGILASHLIRMTRKITVVFPESTGIAPQRARVVYTRVLNPPLCFYGIEWEDRSGEILKKVQELYGARIK